MYEAYKTNPTGNLPSNPMLRPEQRVIYRGQDNLRDPNNRKKVARSGDFGVIQDAWEESTGTDRIGFCLVKFYSGPLLKVMDVCLEVALEGEEPPQRPKAKERRASDRARSGRFDREKHEKWSDRCAA